MTLPFAFFWPALSGPPLWVEIFPHPGARHPMDPPAPERKRNLQGARMTA